MFLLVKKIHNINAKMFMGKKATTLNGETVWVDEADPTYSIAIQKDTWCLTTPNVTEASKEKQRKLLSHAVPGDILVKETHVVFIQNLNYAEGSNVITDYNQVDVIHSTSGIDGNWKTWCVHKGNWFQIEANSNNTLYQLRRLKER